MILQMLSVKKSISQSNGVYTCLVLMLNGKHAEHTGNRSDGKNNDDDDSQNKGKKTEGEKD